MIALVITVIVLLILAGVTIAALSGDNWILTKDTTQELTDQNYTDIKIGISPEAMLVQQATLMTLDLDLHFMVIREYKLKY